MLLIGLAVIIAFCLCMGFYLYGHSVGFHEAEEKLWKIHYQLGFKHGEHYGRWSENTGQELKLEMPDMPHE